jgi:hypothetical protein
MSEDNNSSRARVGGGSIGLGGFVFLILLTLKLLEVGVVASWPWIYIFIPLIIPAAIVAVIIGFGLLCAGIVLLVNLFR